MLFRSTEAFYRDDWHNLVDTAQGLEKAANLLKTARDPSPRLQAVLQPKCDELAHESSDLRAAAQTAAIDRISTHLQKITNIVRELRPDNTPP